MCPQHLVAGLTGAARRCPVAPLLFKGTTAHQPTAMANRLSNGPKPVESAVGWNALVSHSKTSGQRAGHRHLTLRLPLVARQKAEGEKLPGHFTHVERKLMSETNTILCGSPPQKRKATEFQTKTEIPDELRSLPKPHLHPELSDHRRGGRGGGPQAGPGMFTSSQQHLGETGG